MLNGLEDMRISCRDAQAGDGGGRELGYRPRSARAGRRKPRRHRVIGLMIDEIATSPFAAISIEGVQEEAWKRNVLVEVVMTGGDPDYEVERPAEMGGDRVEGVIYGSILTRR